MVQLQKVGPSRRKRSGRSSEGTACLHKCREPGSSEPQTPVETVCVCSPGAPTVRWKTETGESLEFPGLAKLELTTETNKKREPISKTTEGMV